MKSIFNGALSVVMFCLLAVPPQLRASDDYQHKHRLGPGDLISISVYDEPDLSFQVVVDKTGSIDFPFVGPIETVGKTTETLQAAIDQGLRDGYLVAPEVTVTIVRYRPYFINGEVRKPSAYPYTPGITVIKAITLAGGYTQRAAKDKLLIQREGEQNVYRARPDTLVRPGDILTIKESLF